MKRAAIYVLPALLICGWWYYSFIAAPARIFTHVHVLPSIENPHQFAKDPTLKELLSPLNRDEIKHALNGDTRQMLRLIAEWDQDAQLLESKGFIESERLSRQEFIRALTIGRSLKNSATSPSGKKYYPQAWNSATLLLALAAPDEIVALPAGYRPMMPTSIPFIHGDPSEQLWKLRPDVAFVAAYTHPSSIQTLENLQIPLHRTGVIWSIEDLYKEILSTGKTIRREREAELLTLFMKSALIAIDNRAKLLDPYEDTLYLSYGAYFSYPTKKMIAGQLTERLKLNTILPQPSTFAWKIPLEQEQLIILNPKRLILSCEEDKPLPLPEWGSSLEVAYIERSPIESLDQSIILAYFDLYEALSR